MEMVVVFFGCFLYKDNIIIPIWYLGHQVDFVHSLLSCLAADIKAGRFFDFCCSAVVHVSLSIFIVFFYYICAY